ncbi:MAG TPA: hypothetical protein VIK99_08510, partial [Thermaerobacter sp.]
LSSLPDKARELFNRAKDRAVEAATKLYEGFKEWVKRIPGVLGDVFTNIWNEIKTWPSKLWEKAKSIGRSMWEGFKAGLGISSPSYIERALMAIEEQARVTVAEMRSSVRELGRLTLPRPDVGPAMAMAGPGYGGARVVEPGWRGLGRPAWGAPVVEGRRVEVVLVLDGKELARKQLPYLLVEMAAANRDAKRAVGR